MDKTLQKQWHLLAYLFIIYAVLSSTYRILKAMAVVNLAILKTFLLWPPIILLCAILIFFLWLTKKSGPDWKKYTQEKRFVQLFFMIGLGLAFVSGIIADYFI
ncbi:hypothetical protein [Clostridium merdae]|uniref:hypothetical protein n=1 Tax=Clostridium merdae TaxID=1958780 RepID=UPI000A26F01C|nr:hypothetical protein [Clostridium merdae]